MNILITESQLYYIMESGEGVKPYPLKNIKTNADSIEATFDVTSDDGEVIDTIEVKLEIENDSSLKLHKIHCEESLNILKISFRTKIRDGEATSSYLSTKNNKQYKTVSTVFKFLNDSIKENIIFNRIGIPDIIYFSASGDSKKERRQKKLFYDSYLKKIEGYVMVDEEIYEKFLERIDDVSIINNFELSFETILVNKNLLNCIINNFVTYFEKNVIDDYVKNGSVGDIILWGWAIKTLGKLEKVGGYLDLRDCTSLIDLGKLERVGKGLDLRNCTSLTSLGKLKRVGGLLNLEGCYSLKSLGKLELVWDLNLKNCTSLTSLENLKTVVWDLNLEGCIKIESLPENLEVGNHIYIKNSGLEKYSIEELDVMYPKLKGKCKI